MTERLTAEQRRRLQGIVETQQQHRETGEQYFVVGLAVWVWDMLPALLAELERVEGDCERYKAALGHIAYMPCLFALIGEGRGDEDEPCQCAGCVARAALADAPKEQHNAS